MNYENVVNMLNLWGTPDMWHDKTLYTEIKGAINKLSEVSYELSERELYLVQELTNGLLEATLTSYGEADDIQKGELALALNDIAHFQKLITSGLDAH